MTGDDDGAQRVAWTDTWKTANDWFRSELADIDGVSVETRRGRQPLGHRARATPSAS